ncbi:DUF6714 family protein [Simiduia aestuariiviva]|uniref:DNA-directed RNA polymerase subunit RPC12/RpoP n=1 Tax=Simiduia aestuariiviva TaxID=1510459 RepID=A0A839UNH4_9GAMM|nr:DUF6714 family protein [Simiduia aestuariiviva]MBB3167296.1 DNA-directed RNA polymerase subunit RPC12/RpoP [Simiduia aestuariiviva]
MSKSKRDNVSHNNAVKRLQMKCYECNSEINESTLIGDDRYFVCGECGFLIVESESERNLALNSRLELPSEIQPLEAIVKDLYYVFSCYPRPLNFTDYKHCPECEDHNETMKSATLATLESKHLGCVGYSPWCFLTEEGFAHYIPRILELAITGKGNAHGELFLDDILYVLAPKPEHDRFQRYTKHQCMAVFQALLYANKNFREQLVECFSHDDMDSALEYWSQRVA